VWRIWLQGARFSIYCGVYRNKRLFLRRVFYI
jgi:hypothetical protein